MTEPAATVTTGAGLAALAVAMLGPLAGPYALIVFASLAGALWPLSESTVENRRQGAWLLLRVVAMAIVFTGLVSALLQRYAGWDVSSSLAPVAFLFGALGNGWRPVLAALGGAARAWAERARPPTAPPADKPTRAKDRRP